MLSEHDRYVDNLFTNKSLESRRWKSEQFRTYAKHQRIDCGGVTAIKPYKKLITDSKGNSNALNKHSNLYLWHQNFPADAIR